MSEIRDYQDYEQIGDFVVQVHKSDPLKAKVMCMRTGDFWRFKGETCVHDANRDAWDRHFDSMRGK